MERVDVFDMINVRVCNGSGAIKEEPPFDFHQMVVWNGGAEGNRFASALAQIKVRLGQALAGGAHSRRI